MPAAAIAVGASLAGAGAASALGLTAGTLAFTAVSSVISFGVQSLGNRLLAPGDDGAAAQQGQGVLLNTESTVAPIPVVYGRRRVGGPRVFGPEVSGDNNQFLNMVIVWSEGQIDGIDDHYLDDRTITSRFWEHEDFAKDNAVNILRVWTGSTDQAAETRLIDAVPGRWTNEHRLLGTAYTYLKLEFHPNKFTGMPSVNALVRGRRIYDPRTTLTAHSRNPALVIRDYITNTLYGRGIPESAIDEQSFINAANYCDQPIDFPDGNGGTFQDVRYTCDAVVNTDQTPFDNLPALLTCCRGMLIFTGGQYRLRIDRPEAVAFAFTEDNITGGWRFEVGSKRTRANRIRARFVNEIHNRYRDDIVVEDSPPFRFEDNGLLLEKQINLPCTTSAARARHLAQMELKQSRQSILASFRSTLEAVQVEVGDVVSITHTTPGWDAKPFRVVRLEILNNDEVEVTAIEYDASVYVLDALDAEAESPDTELPDPFDPLPPGAPVIDEQEYIGSPGAGVRSKAVISWEESADAFLDSYELQYRVTGGAWLPGGTSECNCRELVDLAPGFYDFRVRSRNNLGVTSDWVQTTKELLGIFAPPSDVTGLALNVVGGLAVLHWTTHPDLDVLIGGRIEFRHSPATSGATWVASASIGEPAAGGGNMAILPLKPGTYLAKARDAAGVLSANAATITTDGGTVLTYSNVATVSEHTAFSGTHSGTVAAASVLKLDASGDVDSIADVDAVANWDAQGGIEASGTYTFAAGIDMTTKKPARLRTVLGVTAVHVNDLIDDRAELIDDWEDFDGDAAGAVVDAQVWERHTDDDPAGSPTWSDWARVDAAEYDTRAFQFQCRLSAADTSYNIHVDTLTVSADEVT